MKYEDTELIDQETIINILYNEEIIRIYSSRVDTIKNLIKIIGKPTKKIKKNKTTWSGAYWDIDFRDGETINKVLSKEAFIDKKFKTKEKMLNTYIPKNDSQLSFNI